MKNVDVIRTWLMCAKLKSGSKAQGLALALLMLTTLGYAQSGNLTNNQPSATPSCPATQKPISPIGSGKDVVAAVSEDSSNPTRRFLGAIGADQLLTDADYRLLAKTNDPPQNPHPAVCCDFKRHICWCW